MELGPPNWRLNPDSLDAPEWIKDIVRAHPPVFQVMEGWTDVLAVDSAGAVRVVANAGDGFFGWLSVSPNENLFAYADAFSDISGDHKIKIFRSSDQTFLTPSIGDDVILKMARFAPNSNRLAVIGYSEDGVGLYLSKDEEFTDFELVTTFEMFVTGLTWSPDGEWLLLKVQKPESGWGVFDLVAVHVQTSQMVEIERPYLLDGKPAPEIFIRY
jgi:WD40 repeat protein